MAASTTSVLVLGATGNVGKPTVAALAAAEGVATVHAAGRDEAEGVATVHAAGRDEAKVAAAVPEGVKALAVDIGNADAVEKAVAAGKYDAVVIVPPGAETRGSIAANAARAAAKAAPAARVILLSVPFADQKPGDEAILFHRQFYEAETALREAAQHWVSLQMTMFFENNLGSGNLRKDGVLAAPVDGKAAFAPVSVADIGAAVVGAVTKPAAEVEGKVFLLTGPKPISLTDQAAVFAEVFGSDVKYVNVPPADWVEGAVQSGWPRWQAEGLVELYAVFLNDLPAGDGIKALSGTEPKDFKTLVNQYKDAWPAKE